MVKTIDFCISGDYKITYSEVDDYLKLYRFVNEEWVFVDDKHCTSVMTSWVQDLLINHPEKVGD